MDDEEIGSSDPSKLGMTRKIYSKGSALRSLSAEDIVVDVVEKIEGLDTKDTSELFGFASNQDDLLRDSMRLNADEENIVSAPLTKDENVTFTESKALKETTDLLVDAFLDKPNVDRAQLFTFTNNFFDVTIDTLRDLFGKIDLNNDGKITYPEFRQLLKITGFYQDDEDFDDMIKAIDDDKSGDIDLEEFAVVVQRLKLASLFKKELDVDEIKLNGSEITFFNFDPVALEEGYCDASSCRKFFYGNRPKWAKCSYINVTNLEEITMERLAVKFRLHPLAVADALTSQRGKVEKYAGHIFISAPAVMFRRSKKEKDFYLADFIKSPRGGLTHDDILHKTNTFKSRKGSGSFDAKVFNKVHDVPISEEDFMDGNFTLETKFVSIFIVDNKISDEYRSAHPLLCKADQTVITASLDDLSRTMWRPLLNKLSLKHSKIRSGDAHQLLYHVLDGLVDNLTPTLEIFTSIIERHQENLKGVSKGKFNIGRTLKVKRELQLFYRMVKPLGHVIRHCIEDDAIAEKVQVYLRDVNETLMESLEDIQALIEACNSIREEYGNLHNNQMNRLMYILTIFTSK